MKRLSHSRVGPPMALMVALAILVGAPAAQLLLGDGSLLTGLASLGVAIILAIFLARGSRLAWILVVIGAGIGSVLGLAGLQPFWSAASSLILLLLLLSKSAREFCLRTRKPILKRDLGEWAGGLFDEGVVGILARLEIAAERISFRVGKRMVARVFAGTLALFIVVGAVGTWRKEARHGNLAWNVAWDIVFNLYKISLVLLVAVILLALTHTVTGKLRDENRS